MVNRLQAPAVLFWGEALMPIFPRRDSECLTYVGPPLQLPTLSEPSIAEIDTWHGKYLEALGALFEASKADAGEPEAVLEIW